MKDVMVACKKCGNLKRGHFRMRGEVFELMPVNEEKIYRFEI